MANPSILTDSQKASFYAVWDAISDLAKIALTQVLQRLVGVQSHVGDGGDQGGKGELLCELDHYLRYNASVKHAANVSKCMIDLRILYLRYNASVKHAANVSKFMIDLRILSSDAVLEMISMTEPGPTAFVIHAAGVQEGIRHDEEERSVSTIATSTAAIVASSASTVASNAATVASNASTVANAASIATTVASTATSESIAATVASSAATVASNAATVASNATTVANAASTLSTDASTATTVASTATSESIASL